MDKTNTKF